MTIRGNFAPNSAPLSPKKVVNTSPERLKRLPSKQPVVGSNPTGGVSISAAVKSSKRPGNGSTRRAWRWSSRQRKGHRLPAMQPHCWKRKLICGVSALAAAPEDCKSITPPHCCAGRSARRRFQPNGLRRLTSQQSSADHGRAERSRRRLPCQTSCRWFRPSPTPAGGLPSNYSAPSACAHKSGSICSFASSTKHMEKSWCSTPAGTATPTGPT